MVDETVVGKVVDEVSAVVPSPEQSGSLVHAGSSTNQDAHSYY